MRVGLHDADRNGFPNLPLMKISTWHQLIGDTVEWWRADGGYYDLVYSSKVFTFTRVESLLPPHAVKGGTGYDLTTVLPDYIEACYPDYTLYGIDYSLGFLTRGCPRRCEWCFVPEKEGGIRPAGDISNFLQGNSAVLMDNNPLACDHGIQQIEKMGQMGIKVDFNQGLDARLIDNATARLLSKLKWLTPLRLACDSHAMINPIAKAVEHLRYHNTTPQAFTCYVLVKEIDDALERVKFLKSMYITPFAQPYIDKDGTPPTRLQRRFARWVNTRMIYKKMTWEDYQEMQGDNI